MTIVKTDWDRVRINTLEEEEVMKLRGPDYWKVPLCRFMIESLPRMTEPGFFLKEELDNTHSFINRDYLLNMSAPGSETKLFLCQCSSDCEILDVFPAVWFMCLVLSHPHRLSREPGVPNMGHTVCPQWLVKWCTLTLLYFINFNL